MDEGLYVFHASTKDENGKIVTSGGRVCAVTGISHNLKGSIERAYEGIERIRFEGRQFRKDIGQKALARLVGKLVGG
jgi:phosphoribosylamine-glycine ligase